MVRTLEETFLKLNGIGLVSKTYTPDVNKYAVAFRKFTYLRLLAKYTHMALNGYILESKKEPEEKKFNISITYIERIEFTIQLLFINE